MDNFRRRRLNTQIQTKTQIALDAIKRYDLMEESRINIQFRGNHSGKLFSNIETDYSKLTSHKPLKIDHNYKLSLFPYSEQFFNLEMRNYLFPMKVLIKNVKNQSTLFIGYDQPYPGIPQQSTSTLFQVSASKQKNYDYKAQVNRDMFVILKNKGNKMINNVYFTLIAGKHMFMCDLRIQFLGLERDSRVMSQVKLKKSSFFQLNTTPASEQTSPLVKRMKTNPTQVFENTSKLFSRSKPIALDKIDNPIRIEEFNLMGQLQMVKHQSKSGESLPYTRQKFFTKDGQKSIFHGTQTIRNPSFGMRTVKSKPKNKNQKSDLDFKMEEVRRNKEILETYKMKQKELKETAGKCKRLIEGYKKTFNQESIKKQKLNRDLVILIYYSKLVRHVYYTTQNKVNAVGYQIKKDYIVNKFVKKLKRAHQHSCSLVHTRHKRAINQASTGIQFLTKIISKNSIKKSEKLIKTTFDFLYPQLLVRHAMSQTNKYRKSIKLIQNVWKTKYHGRMYSLLYFVDNHIQKMMKEFPHLYMFHQKFYDTKTNRLICLDYIKDQSQKYRFIYEAFKRKLEEIEEITKMNYDIAVEKSKQKTKYTNKQKSKIKDKNRQELVVPKTPTKPMHRFYRNSDILKSMVRTWFQIEYKKYIKKASSSSKILKL